MYSNILVPISFDESRDSAGAIDIAKSLVKKGGRVTIMHVIEHVPAYVVSYLPEGFRDEARKALSAELEVLAKKVPGGKGVLIEGHSGRTIVEWVAEHDVDCVVIASHRPGAADMILGSTAAWVVRHTQCSVHVLR